MNAPARLTVALVTGGTGGIGAAAAVALARRGHRLLVTGRDPTRGRAMEQALLDAGAPDATFLQTDHADLAATGDLVARVGALVGCLDVVVACAGAMPLQQARTPEGLDVEVVVDVVGTVALLDGLLAGARVRRIVLVVSDAATRAPADTTQDPWGTGRGGAMRAYARAKRWKLHVAAALGAELRPDGVPVHAASPGPAWTPMTRALTAEALGVPAPLFWLIRTVQRLSPPARAAGCIVRAADDPALATGTGLLVRGRGRARPIRVAPADAARDLDRARSLAAGR